MDIHQVINQDKGGNSLERVESQLKNNRDGIILLFCTVNSKYQINIARNDEEEIEEVQ
jgi:hypothetical protein